MGRCAALAVLGQTTAAVTDFETAISDLTEVVGDYHPMIACAEFRLSQVYFDHGQIEQADAHLQAATRALPPGNPAFAEWIEWGRANALRLRRESSSARDQTLSLLTLRRARNGGPRTDDAEFLGLLAAIEADLGEFEGARARMEEIERLRPNSRDTASHWGHLGDAFARADQFVNAEQAYARCLEIADGHAVAKHQVRCRSSLAAALLREGVLTRARVLVDESLTILREHPKLERRSL